MAEVGGVNVLAAASRGNFFVYEIVRVFLMCVKNMWVCLCVLKLGGFVDVCENYASCLSRV